MCTFELSSVQFRSSVQLIVMRLNLWQAVLCWFLISGKTNLYCILMISSLQGIIVGQPTLQPSTDYYCPNVTTVTYNCYDSQVLVIEWIVEEHDRPIRYVIHLGLQFQQAITQTDHFSANLTNITNVNGNVGDVMTELSVDTRGLENGTNITCRTYSDHNHGEHSSSFLYFSGF